MPKRFRTQDKVWMKFQLRGVSVSKDKKVTREERNINNRQTPTSFALCYSQYRCKPADGDKAR